MLGAVIFVGKIFVKKSVFYFCVGSAVLSSFCHLYANAPNAFFSLKTNWSYAAGKKIKETKAFEWKNNMEVGTDAAVGDDVGGVWLGAGVGYGYGLSTKKDFVFNPNGNLSGLGVAGGGRDITTSWSVPHAIKAFGQLRFFPSPDFSVHMNLGAAFYKGKASIKAPAMGLASSIESKTSISGIAPSVDLGVSWFICPEWFLGGSVSWSGVKLKAKDKNFATQAQYSDFKKALEERTHMIKAGISLGYAL